MVIYSIHPKEFETIALYDDGCTRNDVKDSLNTANGVSQSEFLSPP